jgi:hypothetical protein
VVGAGAPLPVERVDVCIAAGGGHLEVLQWAREHGCEMNELTCAYAAEGGHLDVLRWAREHHCPWGVATCWGASASGHLDVLQWARERGCPWDAEACADVADARQQVETLLWIRAQAQ